MGIEKVAVGAVGLRKSEKVRAGVLNVFIK